MIPPIWYHVRDLEAGREFYTRKLGFTETYFDAEDRWARLERNGMAIGLAEGEPQGEDAEQLRNEGVDVGVVFELNGEMRLLDVFDPEGNRLQFAQEL